MPAKKKRTAEASDSSSTVDKKTKIEPVTSGAAGSGGAAAAANADFERLSSFFKNDLKEKVDEKQTHDIIKPSATISAGAKIKNMKQYQTLYDKSIGKNRDKFWDETAKKMVDWFKPFDAVTTGGLTDGDAAWFVNGKLNVCYNCVDRHALTHPNKTAILWEGDDAANVRAISYSELLKDVCRVANVLKRLGVRKGDSVCLYMPMIPEAAIAMLACTRIGAPHSVVFAGFSADALRDRILDGQCRYVITADEGVRGGKTIPLKQTVDKALTECPKVASVLLFKRTGAKVNFVNGRDVWAGEAMAAERPYCPCEWMDSEDPMFFLYTSGSTGKPKGILHTTGGYLVYAALTHSYIFDIRENDVYGCMADIGWVTGHSYIVYGPLCNRSTTFLFEGSPLHPTPSRYWEMVERHKITIFYTAPTAIRSLMKFGSEAVTKHDRSSLRVLGSVGEPINPEAWRWYYEVAGNSSVAVVDTFWQTETGGIMITPLPGCTPMKPGSATYPFFGIEPVLVNEQGKVVSGNDQKGVLCIAQSWPGMARTIYGDHTRFMNTYLKPYPGLYFTGDGSTRDADGMYWITGRVDDVVNVSGHRIGSAEIESALVSHSSVAESAVIGIPHDVKGQALFAYVTTKNGIASSPELHAALQLVVRKEVGGFALPDEILICPALPKTRSGKIMRRILRKIAEGDTSNLGDITTLADPNVVADLIAAVAKMRAEAAQKKRPTAPVARAAGTGTGSGGATASAAAK